MAQTVNAVSNDTVNTAVVNTDALSGRYLTFTLGESTYGVGLLNVIDIISIQAITPVPNVPAYVKGIINLRGKIIPVVDMRLKFGKEPIEYDDRTCIIVIDIEKIQVGLIVDRVSEVLTFTEESLSRLPDFDQYNSSKYFSSIGRIGTRIVMNIDCFKIFVEDNGM